jgi:hypothetical protein
MDTFLASYIETALWSSNDNNGVPLDSFEYADSELAEETVKAMQADCIKFQAEAEKLFEVFNCNSNDYPISILDYHVAHDFWLTRNHHGAGFWDGDYPEPLAEQLTALAHQFGESNLYLGNDGKFYL